jgi:Phytoene/squalene synthetase
MSTPTALDSFLDKWRQRWPEWAVAEVFVPQAERDRVVAWFALLQEFDDILNIAGDPLPADAKLGWWATELADWAGHRSRHPLGRMLEPVPAPWDRLAAALPDLVAARGRAADPEGAVAALSRYATAVAEVEAVVLGGPVAEAEQIAVQVLAGRLSELGQAAVPQSLLGGDSGTAQAERAQRSWAGVLLSRWHGRVPGAVPRRIWAALARGRLRPQAAGRRAGAHPLRILWSAWRAARG